MPNDLRPGLRPPQFRLSTLMWLVAALCAVFALAGVVGPYGTLVLVLFVLAVFAHVAGNALGTRLRENGDRPQPPDDRTPLKLPLNRPPLQDEFAPKTQLGERRPMPWTHLIVTCSGVLVGASLGGLLLTLLNWDRITIASMLFAIFACGVLGGLAGFGIGSFVRVMIGVQSQALREAKRR